MKKKTQSAEERYEALKLANKIGNKGAAERLGIKLDTLYTWITKAKNGKAGFCDNSSNIPIVEASHLKKFEKKLR